MTQLFDFMGKESDFYSIVKYDKMDLGPWYIILLDDNRIFYLE